jgi:hypothetical protein
MKDRDQTRLEILAQDMGVACVLEALAEYCDRSADTAAEANEGMGPAPPGIELRAWSKRIGGLSKEAPAKKS